MHTANPQSFRHVPRSPFTYWVSEAIRRRFAELSAFLSPMRTVQRGLTTMDDFRYLRTWWQVPSRFILDSGELPWLEFDEFQRQCRLATNERRWVPFAKGGAFSPFYSDIELVINWVRDGEVLKAEISNYRGSRGWGYQWTAAINAHHHYFKLRLTWPLRTNGLSLRILPAGCIFGHKGPAVFVEDEDMNHLAVLLAIMNSHLYYGFVQMLVARFALVQAFEIGLVQVVPMPAVYGNQSDNLADLSRICVDIKRCVASGDEMSHAFSIPHLVKQSCHSLSECVIAIHADMTNLRDDVFKYQDTINDIAHSLYQMSLDERKAVENL